MSEIYSTYEAKAKLSEILRKVRAGRTIRISHRGEPVAEVRPIRPPSTGLQERMIALAARGVLVRAKERKGALTPIERKAGALKRFLEDRDR